MGPGSSFHRVLVRRCARPCPARRLQLVPDDEIKRVVLCTGKVYYDLFEEREKRGESRIQLLRLEQLYPFPHDPLAEELERFPKAEIVWCQEEPKNQGAWTFVNPHIEETMSRLGRPGPPALCRPAGICVDRRGPDEPAHGRAQGLPRRGADALTGRRARRRGASAGCAYEAGLSARSARATYIRHRAWRALRKARDGHEGELKLLSAIVPRDRMAVDVGANRGNYTFFLSRLAAAHRGL